MMLFFQCVIVFAVIASNIHWEWTPNQFLAAIIAYGIAYGATWLLLKLRDWRETHRQRRRARKQQAAQES